MTKINRKGKYVVTEVSRRSNRVGVDQKRAVLCSPEEKNARGWSVKEGLPKVKIEQRRWLNGQTCVESKAWRLLSAVGSTGVPVSRVRLRWRMRRRRVNIESVAAGQNGLVNVRLVITMVRIQTVGQEQAEKQ